MTKEFPTTIIATHVNADFDAIGSMLAAQKLYPGAWVVFPGSQEKNLRDFFVRSVIYLLNMADLDEIDPGTVSRLVVVDTRRPDRLGRLKSLALRPDLEIHVYDHHPYAEGDIRGAYENCRITGATVTILSEVLQTRGIEINPDEATIMGLGIYEDTGSFSFPSTTEEDLRAAAWLLSKGANLKTISSMLSRDFNPRQIALLNDMIQEATVHVVSGIEVVITRLSTEQYINDLAFLVQKMVKMENIDAIFMIARMGNKVHVIARSRIPEVNVGAILTEIGGGGHPYAASASIKGNPPAQVETILLEILYKNVRSNRQAKDIMSSPPIFAHPEISIQKAGKLLTRYNVNALPVVLNQGDEDRLLGFITRQTIEKALYHHLGHVPVKEYMTSDMASAGPEADLDEIQNKIIENNQRILPVMENGKIKGVVTRTDLLKILVQSAGKKDSGPGALPPETISARTRNVNRLMKERLNDRVMDLLQRAGETAEKQGYLAYVVGGFVRDLFLYRKTEDIDLVVEGEGIAFAKRFAKQQRARVHTHAKFGTAVITYPDGFKVDVASARLEHYDFPAALPEVEMSSIKLDLYRRDFTINTLAISLLPDRFGTLIDFFGAQRDMKEKLIRVLHNLSFVEDPTRILRAVRFEQRFGFAIGKLTLGLIESAVKMELFKRLSGRRLFTELRLILSEEDPYPALIRLDEFNILSSIHPALALTEETAALFAGIKEVSAWFALSHMEDTCNKWVVFFMGLINRLEQGVIKKICARLEIPVRLQLLFITEFMEVRRVLWRLEHTEKISNSELFSLLSPFSTETVLFLMGASREIRVKKLISRYFTELKYQSPLIRGKDLIKLGLKPGPVFRRILNAVRDARLNGEVATLKQEMDFVQKWLDARKSC